MKLFVAERARRRLFVHAGVVAVDDLAVLLPGPSLTGKTTLVAALLRLGATYYSDEYAVLDARGRVHPYPAPLGVRRPNELRQTPRPASDFGARTGEKAIRVGSIIASTRGSKQWSARALSQSEGMIVLLANTVAARSRPVAAMSTLSAAMSRARVYSVLSGDADETAAKIVQLVKGGGRLEGGGKGTANAV